MACPLCERRRAPRACPARGDRICTVCCATKRLVAIACPPDCVYLAAASRHLAAPVRRRQQEEARALFGALGQMSEPQLRLAFVVFAVVDRHRARDLAPLADADLAEAAAAVARSLEAARSGLVYEARPAAPAAAALAREIAALLAEVAQGAGPGFEAEAAVVMRAVAEAAGRGQPGSRGYLDLIARVLAATGPPPASRPPESKLILP